MKIRPYVEKLEHSREYTEFIKKYPDAKIVAGFFVLDFQDGQHIHQIDFYLPKQNKVAAFTLDNKITLQLMELMSDKVPEALDINTNIDLDALKGILTDELKNRNISDEITKMVAVIQNVKGKKIWNVNCVLSGMEIVKAHIEDESKTVLKVEKLSMTDLLKKIPIEKLQEAHQQPAESDPKATLKQLNEIQKQIQKEKERLRKEIEKEQAKK